MQVLKRIGKRTDVFLLNEFFKSRLIFSLFSYCGSVVGCHSVFFAVLRKLCVYLIVGKLFNDRNHIAYAVIVYVPAIAYLALNSVAVRDRNVTHIVSQHCHFHCPAEINGCGSLSKAAYSGDNVLMLVVPCDHLALYAESCADKAELAVAVGGLVQIHKIHINAVVGQLFVVLGVEVEHRLFKRFKGSYPHFGG